MCGAPAPSSPYLKLKLPKYTWPVCRGCLRAAGTLVLWVVWAALGLLLYAQLRIATSDEIAIPDAVLRNIEARLAGRGLHFTFGAINCDSKGRILVRDFSLFAKTHDDPVLTAKSVRFEVNPYALLAHKVMPRAARISGASLRIPAMFSSDGTNEALIDDIDVDVEFSGRQLAIRGFAGQFGNLALMCRGGIAIPQSASGGLKEGDELLSDIITAYLRIAREITAHAPQIEAFDHPLLDITLTPDAARIADAKIEFSAGGLRANNAAPEMSFALGPLEARTALDIATAAGLPAPAAPGKPLRIQFSTTDAVLPGDAHVTGARVLAEVPLDDARRLVRDLTAKQDAARIGGSLAITADSLVARGVTARAVTARIDGEYPREIRASATAHALGEDALAGANINLAEESADAHVVTRVTRAHIAALSRELDYDVGAILKPERPVGLDARARFDAGWKFSRARGELDIGPIYAYRVNVDRARGSFDYDHASGELRFSPASAVVGESFARGSYEMNLRTMDYRFLLQGRLRPLAIRGWFGSAWWPDFWDNFAFNNPAPYGDVDVRGNWKNPSLSNVFVFGDASDFSYNKVAFRHALLRIFVRPDFYDALEVFAARGGGFARGSFTHQAQDPGNRTLATTLDFVSENIDPVAIAPAISPKVTQGLAAYKFEKPPSHIKVSGRIDGPASPRGAHEALDIEAGGATGIFYAQIPFNDLSARVTVRDDVVNIERLAAQIADGRLTLKAQVSGPAQDRRIGFDLTLDRASLGRTIQIIENYAAHRRGKAPGKAGGIQQQLASGQLDLRLSADGLYNDGLSFTGNGSAEVTNAELVNINIFGALSQALRDVRVLNFTSVTLTGGQMNFTIDHRKILIPEAVMTGQKALVKLSGEYALDTQFAILNAKVYPLSQSKSVLGKGLGFLLTPVTHLTELKLTGSLDAPKWRFSYGPTSLFRAITGKTDEAPPAPAVQEPQVPQILQRREP